MATLSSKSGPSGIATAAQGTKADTALQPGEAALSNRNLIINGAMRVSQRGSPWNGVTNSAYRACDRFRNSMMGAGTYTVSQVADAPSGFANSFKTAVTTANAALAATSYHLITHRFEGQDLQRLSKGTASAKQLTASFWVKSNVTGNYVLNLFDLDNGRQVGATYTVSVSGAWQYVTVVFPADTTGAFDDDNEASLELGWWLASGINYKSGLSPTAWEPGVDVDRNAGTTVNLASTIGNYFQLTGVQLEVGSVATPFEHLTYGQELALCQRYFYRFGASTSQRIGVHNSAGAGTNSDPVAFPVTMRATPTGTVSVAASTLILRTVADTPSANPTLLAGVGQTPDIWAVSVNVVLASAAQILFFNAVLHFDAEL